MADQTDSTSKSVLEQLKSETLSADQNDFNLASVCTHEGFAENTDSMTVSTESDGFVEAPTDLAIDQDIEDSSMQNQGALNPDSLTNDEQKNENNSENKKRLEKKSENISPSKSAKSKKKEDKGIEHILRALSSLQTTEEKLAALCKKYADLHEENRNLQTSLKQSQRKLAVASREKDQLQTEHTKAVMAKSKLENLCRELQKHNQTIRQESLQRAKEEDEKRKEISQKFQTTIGEIQQQMQDNHDRSKKLREENYELANKLKSLVEQYEAREKHVEKLMQHAELEKKLSEAKLEQASVMLMEEKNRGQKEKEVFILQSTEYVKKLQLKDAELQMYKERYEEFQSTINKSEEMFQKFKQEMEKMTKRIKKLEREGAQWKNKWQNANRALLEMAEDKAKYDKEKSVLANKITKLESLCRAMQAERQARSALQGEGTELPKLDDIMNTVNSDPSPSSTSDVNAATETSTAVESVQEEQISSSTTPMTAESDSCSLNGTDTESVTTVIQAAANDSTEVAPTPSQPHEELSVNAID